MNCSHQKTPRAIQQKVLIQVLSKNSCSDNVAFAVATGGTAAGTPRGTFGAGAFIGALFASFAGTVSGAGAYPFAFAFEGAFGGAFDFEGAFAGALGAAICPGGIGGLFPFAAGALAGDAGGSVFTLPPKSSSKDTNASRLFCFGDISKCRARE